MHTHGPLLAWRVDFNLALASFESNVKGLRHLIDLALSTPQLSKFVFASSIGILRCTFMEQSGTMMVSHISSQTTTGLNQSPRALLPPKLLRAMDMSNRSGSQKEFSRKLQIAPC